MEISCGGTCNNSGADSVTIPRDRYEELIDMETRADVIISMTRKEKYIDVNTLLIVLGESSLEVDKK
jgi:Fe-S-cluster containining protein